MKWLDRNSLFSKFSIKQTICLKASEKLPIFWVSVNEIIQSSVLALLCLSFWFFCLEFFMPTFKRKAWPIRSVRRGYTKISFSRVVTLAAAPSYKENCIYFSYMCSTKGRIWPRILLVPFFTRYGSCYSSPADPY